MYKLIGSVLKQRIANNAEIGKTHPRNVNILLAVDADDQRTVSMTVKPALLINRNTKH